MSKNQDYIAKIRYHNDLPPPLLPPKLLKFNGRAEEDLCSPSLLSSLFRKENVNNIITLDNNLGISIDAVSNPTVFNPLPAPSTLTKLHPADRALLRDPQVARAAKSQPAVSFLRRTEYIGSNKMNVSSVQASRSTTPSEKIEEDSPASQLRSIEATFDNSTKTIKDTSLLKHPLKKNLKAKRVWSLLPDISRMDQQFSTIKFASNTVKGISDLEYRTAIYRKMRLEDVDWMSFYTTDQESAKSVKRTLDDLSENVPKEVTGDGERYKYVKKSDFDMKQTTLTGGLQEIALRFDNANGIVYYNPITDKAELKKRKIQESHRELLEQADFDEISTRIREPTAAELNKRNTLRHKHDSVTYEATEALEEGDDLDDLEELRKDRVVSEAQ